MSKKDIEKEVISCMLQDRDCLMTGIKELKDEYFVQEANNWTFELMKSIVQKGNMPSHITLINENNNKPKLRKGYESEVMLYIPSSGISVSNFGYYLLLLKEEHIKKICKLKSAIINDLASNGNLEELVKSVESLNAEVMGEFVFGRDFRHLSEVLNDSDKELKGRMESYKKGAPVGIPTGLDILNRYMGGFKGGELTIIAARPGQGKTALALFLGKKAAANGESVCFYSLEMNDVSLADRLVLSESGLDANAYKIGDISEIGYDNFRTAGERLSRYNFYIDDSSKVSMGYIKASATLKKNKGECDMIIIDYLQLADINRKGVNREQAVAETTRELKLLSKELNVPVILLSQLNREVESTTDKIPQLSHLRESGAIEQDADTVLLLSRPAYYDLSVEKLSKIVNNCNITTTEGLMIINIAKQRNGSTGIVLCRHNEAVNNFWDF